MSRRFRDVGQTIYSFESEFLVRCPQCARRARVLRLPARPGSRSAQVRLVCGYCGHTKDGTGAQSGAGEAVDWYFHLPLWLQTPCCGRLLWAHNAAHLDFLAAYVQAELREDAPAGTVNGLRNSTLASKLPAWIKSAKHRAAILHSLAQLRATLD